MEEVSTRYHWELEKNHVLMLLPMVEPTDNARRRIKRNTICTFTCLSTAVRLIGAALEIRVRESRITGKLKDIRCISHQFCFVSSKNCKTIKPRSISQLCTTQQNLVWTKWYLLWNAFACHQIEGTFVRVEGIIRLFWPQGSAQWKDERRVRNGWGVSRSLLNFQVGFAVLELGQEHLIGITRLTHQG